MKFRTLIVAVASVALVGAALAVSLPAPELGAVALLASSPIGVVAFGADVSPVAYQDRETGKLLTVPPAPLLACHDFQADADGCLVHSIDGRVRAIVPPAGFEGYERIWPAAAPLIRQLRAADHGTHGDYTG